jgi:hypothetical protein
MPDRLEILRQQRALVQEQLAWFDREIAALTPIAPGTPAAPASPSPDAATPAVPVAPQATAVRQAAPVSPPLDFPEYQADPVGMQSAARRGCLMYAGLAFLLLFLGAVAIYFLGYRDHPVLFVTDKPAAKAPK